MDIYSILKSEGVNADTVDKIKQFAIDNKLSEMSQDEIQQFKIKAHNSSKGTLTGYDCAECFNRGYFLVMDGMGNEAFAKCKCMEIRTTERMLKNSGLYDKVQQLTFDNYIVSSEWQKKCLLASQHYAENPQGWFFIGGQSGCGKTHLCTAIVAQLIKQGKRAKYMLWRDEVVKLKQLSTDYEMYQAQMHLLQTVPVLYIDDFFKTQQGQKPTQADIDKAFEILNTRYNNKLITIISSELMIDDIIDIDEAIAGRINEMAKGHRLNIAKNKERNYRLGSEVI